MDGSKSVGRVSDSSRRRKLLSSMEKTVPGPMKINALVCYQYVSYVVHYFNGYLEGLGVMKLGTSTVLPPIIRTVHVP